MKASNSALRIAQSYWKARGDVSGDNNELRSLKVLPRKCHQRVWVDPKRAIISSASIFIPTIDYGMKIWHGVIDLNMMFRFLSSQ